MVINLFTIALGFTLTGIMPAWVLSRYLARQRAAVAARK